MPIGCLWHFRLESIQRGMAFGRHLGAPGECLRKHWWSKMGPCFFLPLGERKTGVRLFQGNTREQIHAWSENLRIIWSFPILLWRREGAYMEGSTLLFQEHNLLSSLGKESGPFFLHRFLKAFRMGASIEISAWYIAK